MAILDVKAWSPPGRKIGGLPIVRALMERREDRPMDIGRFDKPVRVALGGPGKIRIVSSTREEAECLLLRWPYDGGRKHLAARRACMDVLQGVTQVRAAREAFQAAAKEADILVE